MSILLSTKSKLLEERLKIHLKELYQKQLRGEIKSPVDLQYELYQTMQKAYLNIGKPSFTVQQAEGYPESGKYNSMMKDIAEDLGFMYAECSELGETIETEFKNIEIQRQGLKGKINSLAARVKSLVAQVGETRDVEIFRESLANDDHYDREMVEGELAEINRSAGCLTLKTTERQSYNDIAIKVEDTNGHPGNSHQVKPVGNKFQFYGQSGMHLNLADIIDGNTDTWFECEIFSAAQDVVDAMEGLGFEYLEGISWIGADRLYLELCLELPAAQMVNWVSLVPFIPPDKGAYGPVIDEIILDSGKGQKTTICKDQPLDRDTVFLISRQKLKRAIIKLSQDMSYKTLAGHWSFREPQGENKVDGPMSSIENLNVKYNPQTRGITWSVFNKDTVIDETEARNNLFSLTADNLETTSEAMQVGRYQIGLREISLANYRFGTTSTYISKSFNTKREIGEIRLSADAQVPMEFPAGDWVKFYISIDDGQKWYRIYPEEAVGTLLTKGYIINQFLPQEAREPNIGYIDVNYLIKGVRVKVELERPGVELLTDADYYTPLVMEFSLKVVGGEIG